MTRKQMFLSSVAAGALVLGFTAAPASAFDRVNWEWNLTVEETVTKTVDVNVDIAPIGLMILENMQVQVGDVTAESTVDGVNNNQPNEVGGDQEVNITATFETNYSEQNGPPFPYSTDLENISGLQDPSGEVSGTVDENLNAIDGEITLRGTVNVQPTGTFDAATELPEIVSTATAVGNNSSIESDVAVEVHEGQFLFNISEGGDGLTEEMAALFSGNFDDVNTHHLLGAAILVGALGGAIVPAEVSATSTVQNIQNATVDSSATAVGNNKSITIDPLAGETDPNGTTVSNSLLMGDITQVSVANVSAVSEVTNIDLNNYAGLGELDRPIVRSVATAVGNNLSVKLNNGSLSTD